ncbi:hypothetical protein N9K75_00040 [bacterium]|nr:hypothetical protein [bacterium]
MNPTVIILAISVVVAGAVGGFALYSSGDENHLTRFSSMGSNYSTPRNSISGGKKTRDKKKRKKQIKTRKK